MYQLSRGPGFDEAGAALCDGSLPEFDDLMGGLEFIVFRDPDVFPAPEGYGLHVATAGSSDEIRVFYVVDEAEQMITFVRVERASERP